MGKKLDDLLKKREQLNAQIQKERNKLSSQQRKEDTRRKILLGALMMDLMKKGELDEKKIRKRLDGFLNKDIDRKLFGLPIKS
ncbi:MAG: mobilization protein [Xenococcaceae cyanobacterium MO_188.B29]|nr:mobilization protein [Xenococcaceae cyanobacterium MO_188.B29]